MNDKKTALTAAFEQRESEIFGYQIDIDNFTRAIAKVNAKHHNGTEKIDVAMCEFAQKLADLLFSSQVEQLKAITIRDVIAEQLAEL